MNRKAQGFTLDYVIAMTLFLMAVVFSLNLIINTFSDTSSEDIYKAARSISADLLSEGLPLNWTNETVLKIGLTTDGVFDESKYYQLLQTNYTSTINTLNSNYEYYVFFEDNDGNLVTIDGACGYGSEKVNSTRTYAFSYYFWEPEVPDHDNQFLDEMIIKYNGSIYYRNAVSGAPLPSPVGDPYSDTLEGGLGELIQDLESDNFDLLFLEDPHINDYIAGASNTLENFSTILEEWVADGNTLYIIEHFRAGRIFNTYFNFTNWEGKNNVTIINTDFSLPFAFNETFAFTQTPQPYPLLENYTDYTIIANYSDNHVAILKFPWYDGTVYFFSELNANYQNKDNISDEVDYSIDYTGRRCQAISIDNLKYKNMMKIERFLPYKSSIIRMVVYVWEEI